MSNVFFPPSDISNQAPRAGGWCWAVLIRREDVETWPSINPLTGTITDSLVLKSGSSFYRVQVMEKDRFFRENEKTDGSGTYTDVSVNAVVAGNSTALLLALQTMRFHEWIIMVNDRVDMIRMVGDEDSGSRLLRNYDTGTLDGQREHVLQFGWQNELPCPVYEPSSVLIGSTSVTLPPYVSIPSGGPTSGLLTEDGMFIITEDSTYITTEV